MDASCAVPDNRRAAQSPRAFDRKVLRVCLSVFAYRHCRISATDSHVVADGKRFLNLSATNFLGLASSKEIKVLLR